MSRIALIFVLCFSLTGFVSAADLRVGQVCTLEGHEVIRLEGKGLVVGLNGTGDGGDNLETMRRFCKYLNPSMGVDEIERRITEYKKHGGSVAVVHVSALVPLYGANRGQRIDAQVTALFGATSLAGGRLIPTPVGIGNSPDSAVIGEVEGYINIDDKALPKSGHIPRGALMRQTVNMQYMRRERQVRLLVHQEHASPAMSREIERAINERFAVDTYKDEIAKSVSVREIDVKIPDQYKNPVEFCGLLEEVVLKTVVPRPRIVVNSRAGTIVITGDVEILPAVVTHRNLTIDTTERFVPVQNVEGKPASQQLTDLVEALNRLRVPPQDIVAILRSMAKANRLQAEIVEE